MASVEALLNSSHKGEIFETFVYSELLKHIAYSDTQPKIYHYRTNDKKEIDFIVERGDKIFAIEVKSSKTVKKSAFKHIIDFQIKSTNKVVGIVLYAGDDILSFGDKDNDLYALPLNVFF